MLPLRQAPHPAARLRTLLAWQPRSSAACMGCSPVTLSPTDAVPERSPLPFGRTPPCAGRPSRVGSVRSCSCHSARTPRRSLSPTAPRQLAAPLQNLPPELFPAPRRTQSRPRAERRPRPSRTGCVGSRCRSSRVSLPVSSNCLRRDPLRANLVHLPPPRGAPLREAQSLPCAADGRSAGTAPSGSGRPGCWRGPLHQPSALRESVP
mmetsp:Transcript_31096/g.73919  ORF Transcript_31096/g.73919 Transcript_31096/m.73919 type:complete len:207 (-) Transcript_31096:134-754(-)